VANLNLGILPKHIWKNFDSDQFPFSSFNIEPVGSGPYKITSVVRGNSGIPQSVTLEANPDYVSGKPYIDEISFDFFGSDKALIEALKNGKIESASNLSPETAFFLAEEIGANRITRAPLTRVFGLFFNQNSKEILAHKEVRKALAATTDKESIVRDILYGYASTANSPLPTALEDSFLLETKATATTSASSTLAKAGWKINPKTGIFELKSKSGTSTLSFSISTGNVPDLVLAARHLEDDWKTLGADVDVKVFETSDLNQSVIRPRKYDALLFGIVTGRTPDLYPFWHSSQRNDPGLNISLYANRKVDTLLESIRKTTDSDSLEDQYKKFEAEIVADTPAIFLWSPEFIYAVPEKLGGINLGLITNASDRFLGIEKWYVEKDRVWEVLAKDIEIIN
jgi:peptide/nickel transport system substrate-binding protein